MGRERFFGIMGGCIKGHILMIKNKDMENSFGQMEGNTMECGIVKFFDLN